MFKQAYDLLRRKVPELGSPWKALLILALSLAGFGVCMAFFLCFDRALPWGSLISQFVVALVATGLSYRHYSRADHYQATHSVLAYRHSLYNYVIPILVTWYACCFHPLLIGGPPLLPRWLALIIGALFLAMVPLTRVHLNRAGVELTTQGTDILTVLADEERPLRGEIYGYIRHPLYFALVCCALGCGWLRNNLLALLAALMVLVPVLVAVMLEDRQLVARYGEAQQRYIRQTGALFPRRDLAGFVKLFFLFR